LKRTGWARRGTLRVDQFLDRCWDARLLATVRRRGTSFAFRQSRSFSGSNLISTTGWRRKTRQFWNDISGISSISLTSTLARADNLNVCLPLFFWPTSLCPLTDVAPDTTASFQASLVTIWAHCSDDMRFNGSLLVMNFVFASFRITVMHHLYLFANPSLLKSYSTTTAVRPLCKIRGEPRHSQQSPRSSTPPRPKLYYGLNKMCLEIVQKQLTSWKKLRLKTVKGGPLIMEVVRVQLEPQTRSRMGTNMM